MDKFRRVITIFDEIDEMMSSRGYTVEHEMAIDGKELVVRYQRGLEYVHYIVMDRGGGHVTIDYDDYVLLHEMTPTTRMTYKIREEDGELHAECEEHIHR